MLYSLYPGMCINESCAIETGSFTPTKSGISETLTLTRRNVAPLIAELCSQGLTSVAKSFIDYGLSCSPSCCL